MTTIAWDGRVLAADSQCTDGDGCKSSAVKIYALGDGSALACAGRREVAVEVAEWLADGWDGADEMFTPEIGQDEDFIALLVYPGGPVWRIENRLVRMPVAEKFTAIGSGRSYALGAMACGASAMQAVRVAMLFDAGTGGDISSVQVNTPEPLTAAQAEKSE